MLSVSFIPKPNLTPKPTEIGFVKPVSVDLEAVKPIPKLKPVKHQPVSKIVVEQPVVAQDGSDIEARLRAIGGEPLVNLVRVESNFDPYAVNPSSGACGLGQSLPCSKLLNVCGSLDDIDCQIKWVVDYCNERYGSVALAWQNWQSHGWY